MMFQRCNMEEKMDRKRSWINIVNILGHEFSVNSILHSQVNEKKKKRYRLKLLSYIDNCNSNTHSISTSVTVISSRMDKLG